MVRKKDRNKTWVKRDRKARDEGSRWIKALRENNIVSSERQGGMEKRNGKRVSTGTTKQPAGGKMRGETAVETVGRTEREGGRAACIHHTDVRLAETMSGGQR